MSYKLTTSILLILMTLSVFSQTGNPCNCSSTSSDKIEKLIALAAKGDTRADSFYIRQIERQTIIDPDLEKCARIPIYKNWEQVKELKSRISYLKKPNKKILWVFNGKRKSPEEYDNVYWIKYNRLNCLEEIVSKLEDIQEYRTWQSSSKKVRQELKQKDLETAINNTIVKKTTETETKKKEPIIPAKPYVPRSETPKPLISNDTLKGIIANETIYFKEGEITLDNEDMKTLEKVNQYIKEDSNLNKNISNVTITLEGFASETGSRGENLAISVSRCYTIKKWLEDNGCKNEIATSGYGQTTNKNLRAVVIRVLVK